MSADHTSLNSQPSPAAGRRLRRGDVVHVKPGTPHPIYPDLPMGGWSGTIEQIQKHKRLPLRRCWVQFFKATTDRLHPVYQDRERRDNDYCDLWDNWVLDDQLGPGEVSSETIEHPHLPAWAEKAGDRQVRALFGLDPLAPYPGCEPATWHTWHRFLSEHLPLPRVLARDVDEFDGEQTILERLLLPDGLPADYPADEDRHGIYGELAGAGETFAVPLHDLKLPDEDTCDSLLRDYAHWFDVIHGDSDSDDDFDDVPFGMSREEFERLWKSVRKATFKHGAGMAMPDENDLETAMVSLGRTAPPIEGQRPDYERPEPIRAAPRPGRNDACPCGSGKKYKKCCLRGTL